MNFEPFSRGSSLLHRTDPRVKVISCGVLSLLIAPCQHFNTAIAGLMIGVILISSARLPMAAVMRRLLIVNGFNLLLWLLLPLTYGREPFVHFAGITVSEPGLRLAALITIKANAVLMFFISLLATSTVARLGHGLQELHLSPRLCMLLLFSYRYIFVIEQEYRRLHRAATLRCFIPRTSLHTYRTYSHLLGMLMVKSWNRAARVRQAMELRGFAEKFYCLNELAMNRTDFFILAAMSACGLGLFFLEIMQ